jgi:prophage maintenance system killer protein
MVARSGPEALLVVRTRAAANPEFREDLRPGLTAINEARRAAFNSVVPEAVRQAIIDLPSIPAPDAKSKYISSPNFGKWVVPGAPAQVEFGKRRFEHLGREYSGSFWVFGTVVEPGPNRQAMMTVEVDGKQYQVEGWRIYHIFDKPLVRRDLSQPLPEYVDRMVALGRAPEKNPSLPPPNVTKIRIMEIWRDLLGKVGPHDPKTVREEATLDNLEERHYPMLLEEYAGDPVRLAAEVCYYIVDRHPFGDCNHRTAWSTAVWILRVAGYSVEHIPNAEVQHWVRGIDARGVTVEELAEWLRSQARERNWERYRGEENTYRSAASSSSLVARRNRGFVTSSMNPEGALEVIRASPNPSHPERLGLRDAISRAPIHSGSTIISRIMGSGSGPGGRGGAVNGNPVRCDSSINRRISASHSSQDREDERSSGAAIRAESSMEVIRSSPNPHDPGPWTVRRTQKPTASFKTPRKSRFTVLSPEGRPVAEISRADFYNAHLVAAAPTMLALLKEIERKMALMPEQDPVLLLAVRQAVKEAEARAGEANPRPRAWMVTPEEKRAIDSAAKGYLYAFTVGADSAADEAEYKEQRRMGREFNADVGSLISGNVDPARQRAATGALRTLIEYTSEEDPGEGRHAILKALHERLSSGAGEPNPHPDAPWEARTRKAYDALTREEKYRVLNFIGLRSDAVADLVRGSYDDLPETVRRSVIDIWRARGQLNPSPGGQYDMQIVLPRISVAGRHLIEQILEEHGYDVDGGGTFMDGTCQSDIFLDAGKCFQGPTPKRIAVEWEKMMGRTKEEENPKPGNPFAERAARARAEYERLAGETPYEKSMRESFPLGVGFSKPGGPQRRAEARMEARIDRSVKAQKALLLAQQLEAQAEAFDAGLIDVQGRRISEAMLVRREKRRPAKEAREAKIAAAREQRAGKESWQVTKQIYADASGYVAGGGRALVEYTHRGAVRDALIEGKPVPAEVLADYSDLASMTLEDLQRLRAEENPRGRQYYVVHFWQPGAPGIDPWSYSHVEQPTPKEAVEEVLNIKVLSR